MLKEIVIFSNNVFRIELHYIKNNYKKFNKKNPPHTTQSFLWGICAWSVTQTFHFNVFYFAFIRMFFVTLQVYNNHILPSNYADIVINYSHWCGCILAYEIWAKVLLIRIFIWEYCFENQRLSIFMTNQNVTTP